MNQRRKFIKQVGLTSLLFTAGKMPLMAAFEDENIVKFTILHTNDVHSRVDPFPENSSNAGRGGVAKRAALINKIRKQEKNVLLFDAGDIFQGSPYFNFYKGEIEIKLMSSLGYDAGTMGNHDFDLGIEGFVAQLPHANFPFVQSNYNVENTALHQKLHPYKIFEKDGIKIGVLGLGIDLTGLVYPSHVKDVIYQDPIAYGNKMAKFLRHEAKCDYVICLSHLGYSYKNDRVSDEVIASQSTDIDLIIGGHTHTFLDEAVLRKNKEGKPVAINQVGFGGMAMGRLDIFFERNKKGRCVTCKNLDI